jgi:ABC-2 type transport system permease protein
MSAETSAAGRSPAAGGVIHDLGYRRYDGPRLGRPRIVTALAWYSFRSAFGFGRGAKAKIVPLAALIGICLPAVVNAFVMSRGSARVVDYDTYLPVLRDLIMTVFVAVQAPELVSRDLRSRVLPLYFSRPVQPGDYPLAKYLGVTAACLVMLEVPLLVLYGGSIAHYALGIANAIHPDQNLRAGLSLPTSLILATVLTVGGLGIAARRLEAFSLTGDAV